MSSFSPALVQHRFDTLTEAFQTADRRQRGHLPYDKVLEIYTLFMHNAISELLEAELASFVERHAHHSTTGDLVVDYKGLANALRRRDLDLLTKSETRARQTGATAFGSPDKRGGPIGMSPARGVFRGTGVAAALQMEEAMSPQIGRQYTRPPPLTEMPAYMMANASPPAQSSPMGDLGTRSPASDGQTPSRDYSRDRQFGSPIDAGAIGAAAAGSLLDLLHAAEAADSDRSGLLNGSNLLMCCRMQGIEESSALLRQMVTDGQQSDGRVDYVQFVSQLAAQRAGHSARGQVEHLRSS